MALSDAELRFRPFEPLPFSEPLADHSSGDPARDWDAHAALQTRLAVDGVESITPDAAETFLAEYGLARETRRAVLVEIWQHALKKLLFRDDYVDTGETAYLDCLGRALGLTAEEVDRARSEVPNI